MVNTEGFSKKYVVNVLKKVIVNRNTLDIMTTPPEKIKTWKEYKKLFLGEFHLNGGKQFIKANKQVLLEAEKQYGVPINIITAIIGIETRYGTYTGGNNVLIH